MAILAPEQSTTKTPLPPGPRHLPYLGNLVSLRQDPLRFLQRLQQTYGNMATIYLGKTPAIALFRPEYIRYVLVEHPRDFHNRGNLPQQNDEGFASEGLLTIDGEKHRRERRVVQPAFHKKRVDGYASTMRQFTQDMLKTWQPGETIDLSRAMQELTLRIISQCLFSVDLSAQLGPLGNAFDGVIGSSTSMAEDFLNIHIDNPLTGYGRRMAATRQLDMLIYTLIAQRRGITGEQDDVLSMLFSTPGDEDEATKLTDKQIHDHILTFLAAGHETTAIALTWTFYLLSQYPQVRARLQEEIHSVLADRDPQLADLEKLPYLDWVLNEAMRLYPPAWLQIRFVAQETTLDGVRLPVGTPLILSQWVMHRDPTLWPNAEVFQPERWDPANGSSVPPGAYFPFGGGPRLCIGMPLAQLEARIILASILQRYTPQPLADYVPAIQPVITLRPKNHLRVTLLSASGDSAQWKHLPGRGAGTALAGAERKGCLTALLQLLGFS